MLKRELEEEKDVGTDSVSIKEIVSFIPKS